MFNKAVMLAALVTTLAPWLSEARVVRFVVEQKRPLAEGTSFGSAGAYERLDGTAYFEVDPNDPLNAIIVNLDKAPRNARGMVEFSAPFFDPQARGHARRATARSSTRSTTAGTSRRSAISTSARAATTRSPRPTSATAS